MMAFCGFNWSFISLTQCIMCFCCFLKKAMISRDYFKLLIILTQATLSKPFLLRTLWTSKEPTLKEMKDAVTELHPPQITSNSGQSNCGGRVGG